MADARLNPDFEQRPYWQATMPVLPDRTGRPLPARADVVVVGGGYTGVAAARRLALGGAKVTLLEANRLGWGASTRNGGIIHAGYKWGPRALIRRYGDELGRALFGETTEAYRFVTALISGERIDCDFRECGHVELAYAPSHVGHLDEAQESLASAGVVSTVVPRAALRDEIGSDAYFGGLVVPGSGTLHPGKWFAGLAASAGAAGADLHEGVRARRLRHPSNGRLVVETDRGAIEARDVVVATNGYADRFVPSLRRRIIPIGSYIIATEPLADSQAAALLPRRRMAFDSKHFLYYFRVTADRRLLFGGRAEFGRPDAESTRRAAAILHRGMTAVFPQLTGARIDYAWSGNVAFTRDQMPRAGRLDGVYYSGGYGGHGVAMATYLGEQIARRIAGEPIDHPLFDDRFPAIPMSAGHPWFLPLVGAYYQVKDWLQ